MCLGWSPGHTDSPVPLCAGVSVPEGLGAGRGARAVCYEPVGDPQASLPAAGAPRRRLILEGAHHGRAAGGIWFFLFWGVSRPKRVAAAAAEVGADALCSLRLARDFF